MAKPLQETYQQHPGTEDWLWDIKEIPTVAQLKAKFSGFLVKQIKSSIV